MKESVRIGAVAYASKVVPIWEGLSRYLTLESSFPVEVSLFLSYPAQVRALFEGRIDIAWNTNLAYVQSQSWTGGRARPVAMRDTDRGWQTLLIAPVGASVRTVSDVRGKVVALGSRDSGHATILPVHFLVQLGLREEVDYRSLRMDTDVGKHGDTGTSEQSVLASVLDGRADAGAVSNRFWDSVVAQGLVDPRAVAPIWASVPFSHCMFTARPELDPAVAEQFWECLERMDERNPGHAEILAAEGLHRWLPPTSEGYDDLRLAAAAQGFLDPPRYLR